MKALRESIMDDDQELDKTTSISGIIHNFTQVVIEAGKNKTNQSSVQDYFNANKAFIVAMIVAATGRKDITEYNVSCHCFQADDKSFILDIYVEYYSYLTIEFYKKHTFYIFFQDTNTREKNKFMKNLVKYGNYTDLNAFGGDSLKYSL